MINVGMNQASTVMGAPYGVFQTSRDARQLAEDLQVGAGPNRAAFFPTGRKKTGQQGPGFSVCVWLRYYFSGIISPAGDGTGCTG